MNYIENYFKKNKCTIIALTVMTVNPAHTFYTNLGYQDYFTDVIKVLKK